MVKQPILCGPCSPTSPYDFTAVGSTLLFRAYDETHGSELWKTDGTAAGTIMVKEIKPNGGAPPYLHTLAAVGSTLFFVADDGIHGAELWKSDSTAAGTRMVKDIIPTGWCSYPYYPMGWTCRATRCIYHCCGSSHRQSQTFQ